MHRTEADGNVANEYVDQSLPGTLGTVLAASDRNAIQNELANAIERGGLTLKTAGTETGDQLETLIFDTVLDRTAGLSITNAIDGTNMVLQAGYGLEEAIIHTSGGDGYDPGRVVKVGGRGVSVADGDGLHRIVNDGVKMDFYRGASAIAYVGLFAQRVQISTALSWSGSSDHYTATPNYSTDVPWNANTTLINATLTWTTASGTVKRSAPAMLACDENTGFIRITGIVVSAIDPSSSVDSNSMYLTFWKQTTL